MTTNQVTRTYCGACAKYMTADAFEDHVIQHAVGYCTTCKLWGRAATGSCVTCGNPYSIRFEGFQELRSQFIELVLSLQNAVPHTNEKRHVELDPRKWGSEPAMIIKAAMNPLFWSNMTTPDIRVAIGLMTAVAGQYNVVPGNEQSLEEVKLTDADGKLSIYYKNPVTGVLIEKK